VHEHTVGKLCECDNKNKICITNIIMNIIYVKNLDIQVLQQDIKEHIVETNFMINLMIVINSRV
jgi:hypothetical protein